MEAEDGYEKILREQQLGDRDDSGPSARDIEARRRHDEMLYVAPLFPNELDSTVTSLTSLRFQFESRRRGYGGILPAEVRRHDVYYRHIRRR